MRAHLLQDRAVSFKSFRSGGAASLWKEGSCGGMEADLFEPSALALRHFGGAKLWDKRRTGRLVKTAELLMTRCGPGGTLLQKLPDRADLVGLYRLLD
jgi:hypothetical protein